MNNSPETIKVSLPKAKVVAAPEPSDPDAAGPLKKGEVLDRLVADTGIKRGDVKSVVEGFLALMADHLQAGRDLKLPPLGKVKVVKSKTVGQGATALTVKIRQPKPGDDAAG